MAKAPKSVTIRSYQVGFGDCFLLQFHYDGDEWRDDHQHFPEFGKHGWRHSSYDFGFQFCFGSHSSVRRNGWHCSYLCKRHATESNDASARCGSRHSCGDKSFQHCKRTIQFLYVYDCNLFAYCLDDFTRCRHRRNRLFCDFGSYGRQDTLYVELGHWNASGRFDALDGWRYFWHANDGSDVLLHSSGEGRK